MPLFRFSSLLNTNNWASQHNRSPAQDVSTDNGDLWSQFHGHLQAKSLHVIVVTHTLLPRLNKCSVHIFIQG